MRRRPADPRDALDLFRSRLSKADLHALADIGAEFRCPARWPLMVEGTPAHDLYLVGEETADVYRGRSKIAQIDSDDVVVGEMAWLSRGLRSATVSAVSSLHGVRVPFEQLPELLDRSDGLGPMILTTGLERAHPGAPTDAVPTEGGTTPPFRIRQLAASRPPTSRTPRRASRCPTIRRP